MALASLSSFTLSSFPSDNNVSSLSPLHPKGTLPSSRTSTSIFGGFRSPWNLRIDSKAEKRQLGLLMVSRNGGELDDMDECQIERIGGQEEDDEECTQGHASSSSSPERWDVLGLGQAMVDFSGVVDDGFLKKLGLEKGTRKLINHEERGRVLQAMDGCSYKAAAGGSLSNTLVALARLGCRSICDRPLNVAMAGSIAGLNYEEQM